MWFQEKSILPHGRLLERGGGGGGGGSLKLFFFGHYETKLEFPEEWGGGFQSKDTFHEWAGGGEYGYFLETLAYGIANQGTLFLESQMAGNGLDSYI